MTESNFFEKHAKLVISCFLVFGIIFADFLLANIYKAIAGESIYRKIMNPAYSIERKYRTPSHIYHHDLKRNANAPAIWGPRRYQMITNSLGFRDKENRQIANKSDKYRIVFMGDSFVEASGVNYTDSFVGILAQKYADKYDILNAGVVSYAPTVYYRKSLYYLEKHGLEFNEMVVFVDISDIADEMDAYAHYDENAAVNLDMPIIVEEPKEPQTTDIKSFFRENSILYGIPRFIKAARSSNTKFSALDPDKNPGINSNKALWTVDKAYYAKYGEAGLKKAQANMLNLKKLLDKHHIKLTLAIHPWPAQIFHDDLDSIQVTEWQDFCAANGIDFINLFPYFISKNHDENKRAILEYYIENDMHWNEKGNQKVAKILEQKLAVFSGEGLNEE